MSSIRDDQANPSIDATAGDSSWLTPVYDVRRASRRCGGRPRTLPLRRTHRGRRGEVGGTEQDGSPGRTIAAFSISSSSKRALRRVPCRASLCRVRPGQPIDRRDVGEGNQRRYAASETARGVSSKQRTGASPALALPDLNAIAEDLEAAWKSTNVTMRCRQQLVRALVNEIVVDIDEAAREIVLIIHWKGGQHSELRAREKPCTGEHACSTSDDALRGHLQHGHPLVRPASRPTLNRMGLLTGQNKTWTAHRACSDPARPWRSRLQVRREGR